jgi:hypothetical protein
MKPVQSRPALGILPAGGALVNSLFEQPGVDELLARIELLRPDLRPQWGKMNAAQMLAHNSLIFESVRFDSYPKMNPLMRWIVNRMIRGTVLGDRPYRHNSRTAPGWDVSDPHDFEKEKGRIVENLRAVHALGAAHFEGKRNPTFGVLTAAEWNRVFVKHLDYHLGQFGV